MGGSGDGFAFIDAFDGNLQSPVIHDAGLIAEAINIFLNQFNDVLGKAGRRVAGEDLFGYFTEIFIIEFNHGCSPSYINEIILLSFAS